MAVKATSLDQGKALEAMVFIAARLKEPTLHSVSKILYFADKLHLERVGRLITGDTYIAMENGPVPSWAYDVMKAVGGRGFWHKFDIARARKALAVEGYAVAARRAADERLFSPAELECLNESLTQNGEKSFGQLTDESHDGAWGSVNENEPIPLEAIASILPSGKEIVGHLDDR